MLGEAGTYLLTRPLVQSGEGVNRLKNGVLAGTYRSISPQDAIQWIGFIRNANVKLRQEQVGSGALWIKPVERNHPVKLLRSSMGIVRRTLGLNTDTRACVMQ